MEIGRERKSSTVGPLRWGMTSSDRNLSVTSHSSLISDVTASPFFSLHKGQFLLNHRAFENHGSIGSHSSIVSEDSAVFLKNQQTLSLMARLAAKTSFSVNHDFVDYSLGEDDSDQGEERCCSLCRLIPIIDPTSLWRVCWDIMIFLLLIYIAVYVPFSIGFSGNDEDKSTAIKIIDRVTDVVFIVDILLCFITAYATEDGNLVRSHWLIAKNYLRSYFWIDVLSGIPWDVLPIGNALSTETNILKLTKISKLLRVMDMLKMARTARLRAVGAMFSEFFALHHNLRRISVTIVLISFLIHFNACFFGYVSSSESSDTVTWIDDAGLDETGKLELYVNALYWSVTTITTVGYGDVKPITVAEKLYCIFSVAIGAVVYGATISTFVAASANMKQNNINNRLDTIVSYMRSKKFPKPLFRKVFSYFRHYYARKTACDEAQILNELSETLRVEVSSFMAYRRFYRNDLFNKMDVKYLTVILLMTKPMSKMQGEKIFTFGTIGLEMYIIIKGKVQLSWPGDADDATIDVEPHDNIGESCAMGLRDRRAHNATALEMTEVLSLSKDTLLGTLGEIGSSAVEELRRKVKAKYVRIERKRKKKQRKTAEATTASSASDEEAGLTDKFRSMLTSMTTSAMTGPASSKVAPSKPSKTSRGDYGIPEYIGSGNPPSTSRSKDTSSIGSVDSDARMLGGDDGVGSVIDEAAHMCKGSSPGVRSDTINEEVFFRTAMLKHIEWNRNQQSAANMRLAKMEKTLAQLLAASPITPENGE